MGKKKTIIIGDSHYSGPPVKWPNKIPANYMTPNHDFGPLLTKGAESMKKRIIVVSFECDAPDDVIQEIAEQMRWQLDSLNDGTLEMNEGEDPVDYEYANASTEVREG